MALGLGPDRIEKSHLPGAGKHVLDPFPLMKPPKFAAIYPANGQLNFFSLLSGYILNRDT